MGDLLPPAEAFWSIAYEELKSRLSKPQNRSEALAPPITPEYQLSRKQYHR